MTDAVPLAQSLSLRPANRADEAFEFQVYSDIRMDELQHVDWSEAQLADFLQMQFKAQSTHYHTHFPDAAFSIIMQNEEPVGRLHIDRRRDEIRIIDIALKRAFRNQGIGSYWLHNTLDEARQQGLPVRIHVERYNPALNLYQRLGFKVIEQGDVYLLMEHQSI